MRHRAARPPEPVARALRAVGVPAREVGRYWAQERRSLELAVGALSLGAVATLVAGIVLGSATGPLREHPGLLLLIPPALGMRGSIFGALASRLGTSIHTGAFTGEISRETVLGREVETVALLTITTSVEAALLAAALGAGLGRPVIAVTDLVTVSLLGGILSSAVLLAVTIALARLSHARDWNMDDVGAPLITATGDLITMPAILLAVLLLDQPAVPLVVGLLGLAAAAGVGWFAWRHPVGATRRVVRESMVVLTLAVSLQVLAGSVIDARLEQFVDVPALLVLIPPFIANSGSLGGMLSSRLASKLHIGLLEPRALPGRLAGLDISITFLLATGAFTGVGAVGWVGAALTGLSPPGILTLVAVSLLGGLLATVLLSSVAYSTASATFRFGLDPDNHGIPVVTSTMDFLGMLSLVAALAVVGV